MIRNFKILVLVSMAALAIGVLSASGASAKQGVLTVEAGTQSLFGFELFVGPPDNQFTAFGSFFSCPNSSYTGYRKLTLDETSAGKKHAAPQNGDTAITIAAKFKQAENNCEVTGGRRGTIDMKKCDLVFTIGETTEAADTYGVTGHVICPSALERIHISIWSPTAVEHGGSNQFCTLEIPEQSFSGPHITTNTDLDRIAVAGTFTKLTVARSGLCLFDGEGNHTTTGEWDVNLEFTGSDAMELPTGVTVTDTAR